jgi:O-antigen ligase
MLAISATQSPRLTRRSFAAAEQPQSIVHKLSLLLVAITVISGGVVFSEPAPVDGLTFALVFLLPTVGLVAINPALLTYASLWAVAGAAAVLAATFSLDLDKTLIHVSVTLYLYLASAVFAAFIAKSPTRHAELIFKAWTIGALLAATAAFAGYFNLFGGAHELFTRYDRAAGTFKDPNVLGPFLVAPILYLLHVALTRSWVRMVLPLGIAGFLAFALLLTFSRGAWMNIALAGALYGFFILLTSDRAAIRLKLVALMAAAVIFTCGIVAYASTSSSISSLFAERASLSQSYDTASDGRFGGQEKAIGLILENPLGIGAQEFVTRHHLEEAHNVYLSVLLNAGWLGGGIYWIMVVLTLVLGFRHALKRTPWQPLFLIAYSAFVANAMEGVIVDTDHWRHFYLLMAIVWGMMCARPWAEPSSPEPKRATRLTARARAPRPASVRWPEPRQRLPKMLPRMLREQAAVKQSA